MIVQQLFNGLVVGSTYALIAAGFSLVYGILGVMNVAHGEFYMLGAYFGLLAGAALGNNIVAALLGAVIGIAVVAFLVELLVLRPLARASLTATFIATLGVSLFFQNLAADPRVWGPQAKVFPTMLPSQTFDVGPLLVTTLDLTVLALAWALMVGLKLSIDRTAVGKQVRAVAENPEIASFLGVNVRFVFLVTVILSAIMAAIAGVLVGTIYSGISPFMGGPALLKAIAIVVLGGPGNVEGAMAGSLLLGLAEAVTATYLSSTYADLAGFLILAIVLLLRPQGLFGSKARTA